METNSLRLLVVDDEEASRYGIRRALEAFGNEIAEAESAEAARALMRERSFDLVLLDVNLPGISGLDFLTELQSGNESNQAEIPLVIIITAHGSERLAVQAVKSGAYDYIAKPFELDDLRLVVKNAFETIKLRRENQVDEYDCQEQRLEHVREHVHELFGVAARDDVVPGREIQVMAGRVDGVRDLLQVNFADDIERRHLRFGL